MICQERYNQRNDALNEQQLAKYRFTGINLKKVIYSKKRIKSVPKYIDKSNKQ